MMMAANYAARLLKSCKNVIYSYNGECVRMEHAGDAEHSTGLNVGSSMVIVFAFFPSVDFFFYFLPAVCSMVTTTTVNIVSAGSE